MTVRVFDSLSRTQQPLLPGEADGIFRFYNCGPTVYAAAHIGNLRTFIVNDLIRRLLELELGKDRVLYVRNITDVDDKTIQRATGENRPLAEVTRTWTEKFHRDCAALNILPPHREPTATGHIAEQIELVTSLLEKGHAYRSDDGSVYFKVASFPDYGRLSRIQERELQTGRAHDSDEKEDGSDFALWKARKPEDGDVYWDSPWGQGRPGWHLECSAMACKHLGKTIDLHTGGVDLLFPHHENEIAQSECGHGAPLARVWYHSEHLLVDGRKMAKSLGNMYTLEDIGQLGHSPMALRYALLAGHPRKQLNFSLDSLKAAGKAMGHLSELAAEVVRQAQVESPYRFHDASPPDNRNWGVFATVRDALHDDLNTPLALGELFRIRRDHYSKSALRLHTISREDARANLAGLDKVLYAFGFRIEADPEPTIMETPPEIVALAEKRKEAKLRKDYVAADALREEIAAAGWRMKDTREGTYTLEPI